MLIPVYWYVPTNNQYKISTKISQATLANLKVDQNKVSASKDDRVRQRVSERYQDRAWEPVYMI